MSTKNLSPVLKTSFVLLAILVLLGIVMPDGYQVWSEQLREVISDKFGWFYLLLVTSIVLLCGFFLVSPVGQIKLGEPNSVPEHSTISWIAMIFSAGMGIGLVFYGAAEPLSHYATPITVATTVIVSTILPRIPFVFLPNKGFKVTDKRYFSFFRKPK